MWQDKGTCDIPFFYFPLEIKFDLRNVYCWWKVLIKNQEWWWKSCDHSNGGGTAIVEIGDQLLLPVHTWSWEKWWGLSDFDGNWFAYPVTPNADPNDSLLPLKVGILGRLSGSSIYESDDDPRTNLSPGSRERVTGNPDNSTEEIGKNAGHL